MLFLVRGTIRVGRYMSYKDTNEQVCNLVHANTIDEARQKFTTFYESKTNEYEIYYSVVDVEVMETIL